jgi:U3 small nucleolar RNA-associated protein 19
MPTSAGEIDEWFCSKPLPLAPKIKSISSSKKRKAPSRDPSDTSTGVFDSSSESEAEETVVVSRKTTKLLPPLLSLPAHKKAFQECWMALLTLPLEEGEVKRILGGLHRGVLPHMSEATRLMDWLVDSVDVGEFISVRYEPYHVAYLLDDIRGNDRNLGAEWVVHVDAKT